MAIYKSKIGLEFVVPLTVIIAGTGIIVAYEKIWIALALVLLLVTFIVYMFLTTYYEVGNNTLKIKCGFFVDKTINLDTIRQINETNNPVSSPATSLDRLEITYNKYDVVIISPKDKCAFINHLIQVNHLIKVTLKEKSK
ncbi:PH domain-containing protein [Segetibacter koreensis]|uniref:PH domain-containing protein n=1 Tax=Segetibacter koreensis TaxID=398037 RepID=UPI000382F28E|nr:PH domain-containing protein [Segetibacter koreensis]